MAALRCSCLSIVCLVQSSVDPGVVKLQVLAKVEEANQIGRQLPPDAFYNELIR